MKGTTGLRRGRRNNSFENTDMKTLEWNYYLEASEVGPFG
jgi:hypothetical protein